MMHLPSTKYLCTLDAPTKDLPSFASRRDTTFPTPHPPPLPLGKQTLPYLRFPPLSPSQGGGEHQSASARQIGKHSSGGGVSLSARRKRAERVQRHLAYREERRRKFILRLTNSHPFLPFTSHCTERCTRCVVEQEKNSISTFGGAETPFSLHHSSEHSFSCQSCSLETSRK